MFFSCLFFPYSFRFNGILNSHCSADYYYYCYAYISHHYNRHCAKWNWVRIAFYDVYCGRQFRREKRKQNQCSQFPFIFIIIMIMINHISNCKSVKIEWIISNVWYFHSNHPLSRAPSELSISFRCKCLSLDYY